MMFNVYFNEYYTETDYDGKVEPDDLRLAAVVQCDDIYGVYPRTNTHDESWVYPRDENIMIGLRSFSNGDVVQNRVTGVFYLLETGGYRKLDWRPDVVEEARKARRMARRNRYRQL